MNRFFTILATILIFVTILSAQERRIKAGDGIEIVVYGHQELSRIVTVSTQGTIDFPFMQNLPVDGLTLEKLREIVVAQLSRYLDTFPVITISFTKSTTMFVNVMGMVNKPGIVQMPLGSTIQGALTAAGGLIPGALASEINLIRGDGGQAATTKYDMEKFLLDGDLRQNPLLVEGDAILVTGTPQLSNVKVLGEVRLQGIYDQFTGATVVDMIMRAGGPTKDANINKIRYISPSRKKAAEYIIDLDKYVKNSQSYPMPVVKAGDIIYVPARSTFYKNALAYVRDFSTLALAAYYITRIYKEN